MAKKITAFKPWETMKDNGIEKRYIRLGDSQLVSEAMRALSNSAFRVYVNMRIESAGNQQFKFTFSKYKSYMTRPTFKKAVKDLEEKGFIDVVEHNANLRKANKYRFSEKWRSYIKPI